MDDMLRLWTKVKEPIYPHGGVQRGVWRGKKCSQSHLLIISWFFLFLNKCTFQPTFLSWSQIPIEKQKIHGSQILQVLIWIPNLWKLEMESIILWRTLYGTLLNLLTTKVIKRVIYNWEPPTNTILEHVT
jgi:hypothetical protein